MEEGKKVAGEVVGLTEGARRATGVRPTTGGVVGPLCGKHCPIPVCLRPPLGVKVN
jgi:hypothetical protein